MCLPLPVNFNYFEVFLYGAASVVPLVLVERPNLGCRQLIYRHQSKILPGLSRDVLDWVVETRKKSAALLYTIIINSEASITQHMQLVIDTIYKAAIDEEQQVVQHVSSDTWMSSIVQSNMPHCSV